MLFKNTTGYLIAVGKKKAYKGDCIDLSEKEVEIVAVKELITDKSFVAVEASAPEIKAEVKVVVKEEPKKFEAPKKPEVKKVELKKEEVKISETPVTVKIAEAKVDSTL